MADELLQPPKYEKKAELALREDNLPAAMKWMAKAEEARRAD